MHEGGPGNHTHAYNNATHNFQRVKIKPVQPASPLSPCCASGLFVKPVESFLWNAKSIIVSFSLIHSFFPLFAFFAHPPFAQETLLLSFSKIAREDMSGSGGGFNGGNGFQ